LASMRWPIRVGRPHAGQTTCTFEMSMNCSLTVSPPVCPPREPCAGRTGRCRVTRATPSTMPLPLSGSTFTTRPRFPRSLPAITWTSSFLCTSTDCRMGLQHLRGERDDLHEPLLPQLPGHGPEDARPSGVSLLVDEHHGVLVELDIRAVGPAALLGGAHHHGPHHVALLDPAPGQCILDRGHDDVADARVPPPGTAQDAYAQDLLGSRVVRDLAPGLLLNHSLPFTWRAPRPQPGASAWSWTVGASPRCEPGRPRGRCSPRRGR